MFFSGAQGTAVPVQRISVYVLYTLRVRSYSRKRLAERKCFRGNWSHASRESVMWRFRQRSRREIFSRPLRRAGKVSATFTPRFCCQISGRSSRLASFLKFAADFRFGVCFFLCRFLPVFVGSSPVISVFSIFLLSQCRRSLFSPDMEKRIMELYFEVFLAGGGSTLAVQEKDLKIATSMNEEGRKAGHPTLTTKSIRRHHQKNSLTLRSSAAGRIAQKAGCNKNIRHDQKWKEMPRTEIDFSTSHFFESDFHIFVTSPQICAFTPHLRHKCERHRRIPPYGRPREPAFHVSAGVFFYVSMNAPLCTRIPIKVQYVVHVLHPRVRCKRTSVFHLPARPQQQQQYSSFDLLLLRRYCSVVCEEFRLVGWIFLFPVFFWEWSMSARGGSSAWPSFEKIDGGQFTQCKLCNKEKYNCSTASYLREHLSWHHPSAPSDVETVDNKASSKSVALSMQQFLGKHED